MMPTCKELSELITQGLDTRLPLRKRIGMRLHLMMCTGCRRVEKQLRFLNDLVRRHFGAIEPEVGPESGLSDEARARIRTAIQEASA